MDLLGIPVSWIQITARVYLATPNFTAALLIQ